MAKRKNSKGYCEERSIEVVESQLCDYFQGKRKNSKPRCRNCSYFHLIEAVVDKNVQNEIPKDEEV